MLSDILGLMIETLKSIDKLEIDVERNSYGDIIRIVIQR